MNFYKTANGLELLTDWGGDCHDEKIDNKNKDAVAVWGKEVFEVIK